MTHQDLQKQAMIAASKSRQVTLFPNRVAKGWVGQVTTRTANTVTLSHPRPIESGLGVGSSDLVGVTRVTITPDMVGRTMAVFTACEVKVGKDKLSKAQREYLALVKSWGGIAVELRDSVDGLGAAVDEFLTRMAPT